VATRFYLRSSDAPLDIDPTTDIDRLLSLTAGAGSGLGVWNSIAGPVSPPSIATQVTDTGGTRQRWLTLPLDAVTIEGTLTLNLSGRESSSEVNATFWVRLYRADGAGVDLATIDSAVRTGATELSHIFASAHNWTRTPTSTGILQGERIGLEVHFDDASGVTMGSGGSTTLQYGDTAFSYVEFAETVTVAAVSQVPKDQMHIHGPVVAQQE
jgi:hypothetical protein